VRPTGRTSNYARIAHNVKPEMSATRAGLHNLHYPNGIVAHSSSPILTLRGPVSASPLTSLLETRYHSPTPPDAKLSTAYPQGGTHLSSELSTTYPTYPQKERDQQPSGPTPPRSRSRAGCVGFRALFAFRNVDACSSASHASASCGYPPLFAFRSPPPAGLSCLPETLSASRRSLEQPGARTVPPGLSTLPEIVA